MRRGVVLAVLALTLPMTAWASGINLTNQFGTISISNTGIISKGSELISFNGVTAPKGNSLGSVSFSTGALNSGSIAAGGTFSSSGSSFTVIGKGNFGQPKGTIFTGAFVGPITWTLTSPAGQKNLTYVLTGTISGTLYNGRRVTGTITENFYTVQGQLTQGIGHIGGGTTNLATPEPGTLGLIGTGLVGLGGMFRRKLMSR